LFLTFFLITSKIPLNLNNKQPNIKKPLKKTTIQQEYHYQLSHHISINHLQKHPNLHNFISHHYHQKNIPENNQQYQNPIQFPQKKNQLNRINRNKITHNNINKFPINEKLIELT
jgi:hypothetical protein